MILVFAAGGLRCAALRGPYADFPPPGEKIILGSLKNASASPVIWDDKGLVALLTKSERRGIDPKVREGLVQAVRGFLEDRGYEVIEKEEGKAKASLPTEPEVDRSEENPPEGEEREKEYQMTLDIHRFDVTRLRPAAELDVSVSARLVLVSAKRVLWEGMTEKSPIRGETGIMEWDLERYMAEVALDLFKTFPRPEGGR